MIRSEYFTLEEFTCRDGTAVPMRYVEATARLIDEVLDPIRKRWGSAIMVISGYRTPSHNIAVRGAGKSQHLLGAAADIAPMIGPVSGLAGLIEAMLAMGELPVLGGLGIYPKWVHVDVRARGGLGEIARWRG